MKELYALDDQLYQNLIEQQYKKPTAVQMSSIPYFFQNKNLLVIAPTGSGKTLSYGIPLLTKIKKREQDDKTGVKAFILAPSMELVVQIERELIYLNNKNKNKLKIKSI